MSDHLEDSKSELSRLEKEIENILNGGKLTGVESEFYKAIQEMIQLSNNSEDLHMKLEELAEIFAQVAAGNFGKKLSIPNQKNFFSFIAATMNVVIEELEANVVKKSYLESTLQHISELAIITDEKGIILFVNPVATSTLKRTKEDLIRLQIANIFESLTRFGDVDTQSDAFKNREVRFRLPDETFLPMFLSVEILSDKPGTIDGYLYLARFTKGGA